jgi:hypothetical protein
MSSGKSVRRKWIPKPDDMSDSEDEDIMNKVLSSFGNRIYDVSRPYFEDMLKAVSEEIKKTNNYGSEYNDKFKEAAIYSLVKMASIFIADSFADSFLKRKQKLGENHNELDTDNLNKVLTLFKNRIYDVSRPYFEDMLKAVDEEIKKTNEYGPKYNDKFKEAAIYSLVKMADHYFDPSNIVIDFKRPDLDKESMNKVLTLFGNRIYDVSRPYFEDMLKAVDEEIKKNNNYGSEYNDKFKEEAGYRIVKSAKDYFDQTRGGKRKQKTKRRNKK